MNFTTLWRNRWTARGIGGRWLVSGMALATALLTPAWAQSEAAAASETVEEVVITGSRIAAPNLTSTSPIQVVTAQEIQLGGKTDIVDLMNQLPQNFQNASVDFSNTSNGLSNAGGLTTADLRGLGPQRTLVLVNGRRLGTGDPSTQNPNPAPDLNQIPVALVERVEVVTGGASAAYGSDAVAGVVNFILKKDFKGLRVDGQIGENWHVNSHADVQALQAQAGFPVTSGTEHDGRTKDLNVLVGTDFADGTGNVSAYLGYHKADPVTSAQRDWGACQLNPNDTGTGARCVGSQNSNLFTSPLDGQNYTVVGNRLLPWPQAGSSPPPEFNSQQYIYLSHGDERHTAGFLAHLDLNSHARPYAEFGFMNDRTEIKIAPSGLFQQNPLDATLNGNWNINCDNPLLSSQEQAILCSPAQIAAAAAAPGTPCPAPPAGTPPSTFVSPTCTNVNIGRRNIEGGGRGATFEHNNYRGVVGVTGAIDDVWQYDAYGQYYYTTLFNANTQYFNYALVTNALQVGGSASNPVCLSGPPCVPWNIFSTGAVTPAQVASLYTDGTSYGSITQRIVHLDFTGELGKYGAVSPLARDGLAVNAGFEHRSEQLTFKPDAAELGGLLAGFGGAPAAIDNGYSVREEFVEARVPIAQERAGIKDLTFDGGYRRSHYTTAGDTDTFKLELQYAPVRDVRLRGGFQRAVRAPNIIELFTPLNFGGISPPGVDPCAPTRDAAGNLVPASATLIQCERTGVTAAQYGNGGSTNTIRQCVANQCSQEQGGNVSLRPEKASSYNAGVTLTPAALPQFNASIDWYRITVEQIIGTVPAPLILQSCLQGDPTYCNQIVRTAAGGLSGSSIATGGFIVQTGHNIAAGGVEGVDVQANYRIGLAPRWGALVFSLSGSELLSVSATPYPGAHTYDCAGLYGPTCATLNPRWRHNLRMSWESPWNTTVSMFWRYIGSVKLDSNTSDPSLSNGEFRAYDARLPGMSYIDLAASWDVTKNLQLRAGVNNLLDKDPPIVTQDIVPSGLPNAYPTYDLLGRQLFFAFTATF